MEDEELPDHVARLLSDTGVDADGVVFEITERTALSRPGIATDVLDSLRAQGARLAV
ncbi:MAG: EAL domain-containing protein, partial [Gemmatimonadetes bacterium]|nr:EAL domain-containing protein [Gemmatimonadota bacterium]NIQ56659.1 EAL domain-containing protein [Gemmatimonadota bacterium]NIU76848.1 EAL domain-containing protein [Gammaproteobacteria bacterium]NIX46232.1 EAL domain-containing protein [Gemmatimonadota bacterium]